MSAAFTPGPWAAEGLLIAKPHYQSDPIAWVARSLGDRDDVIKANANLIAAAPRMYESLDETHRWVRRIQDVMTGYLVPDGYDADEALSRLIEMLDGPEQREIQGRAFAALAQARGEQVPA